MDKTKKRVGTSGKQRPSSSKTNRTKVEVYRHFDPVLKSRSYGADDFPEVFLSEKVSARSAAGSPSKNKRKHTTAPCGFYEIELVPDRNVSCDRRDYKLVSSTSSASSHSKKKATRRTSPPNVSSRDPKQKRSTQSNCSSNPKSKDTIPGSNSKNKIRSKSENVQPPCPPCRDFEDSVIVFRDPFVEKIKHEIGVSAKFCNDEVKQTVAELKEEIAKYRRTLNRNVNFLQSRVRCGLRVENFKENAVQTEPSPPLKDLNEFNALVTRIAELISGKKRLKDI